MGSIPTCDTVLCRLSRNQSCWYPRLLGVLWFVRTVVLQSLIMMKFAPYVVPTLLRGICGFSYRTKEAMITISHTKTAWCGDIILSREFYNPETKDYIHIEAHEIGAGCPHLSDDQIGEYEVAFWVPDGNDGDHGFAGDLHHVVKCMQEYIPPVGFEEMSIPLGVFQ